MKNKLITICCQLIVLPLIAPSLTNAGDCSPANAPNTCWQFSGGQRITVKDKGIAMSDSNPAKRWSYEISAPPGTSATMYMGMEAQLGLEGAADKISATNNGQVLITKIHQAYQPDNSAQASSTATVGKYDCLRSYLSLPLQANITSLSVETPQNSGLTIMPVALCNGSASEKGVILGPRGQQITTLFIDQTADGHGFAIEKARDGSTANGYRCPAAGTVVTDMASHCNPMNFAMNYEAVKMATPENGNIFLSFTPGSMPADKFPANGAINYQGNMMSVHTGALEYVSEGAVLQFANSGTCFKINGVLRCY
ncbi:MAG: hypothetical protein OEV64_08220 [Desulfobulbaceae bacterium]|nr:hypothetical protein [Desulfobulbaceae bacterium]